MSIIHSRTRYPPPSSQWDCFYVVGCLRTVTWRPRPPFRTFIGVIPMLASINLTIQLLRVARLKGRLQEVFLGGARVIG